MHEPGPVRCQEYSLGITTRDGPQGTCAGLRCLGLLLIHVPGAYEEMEPPSYYADLISSYKHCHIPYSAKISRHLYFVEWPLKAFRCIKFVG